MNLMKPTCNLMVASLLLFASPAVAGEKVDYRNQITTTATYSAGSPAVDQVRSWLIQNAKYIDGEMIGDPTELGEVRIQITRTTSGLQAAGTEGAPAPPVPLPLRGNPGDIISITSETATATRTWTYEWKVTRTFGGWTLIGYSFDLHDGGGGGPVTDPK